MAQVRIKMFDFLPGENVFYESSWKLYVDFELILEYAEVNYDKEYEVVFSISSFSNAKRDLKALAGNKLVRILTDNNAIPRDHKYTIEPEGRLHILNSFLSAEINEDLLTANTKHAVFSQLFITAELYNNEGHKFIGFSESTSKSLFNSKQAS